MSAALKLIAHHLKIQRGERTIIHDLSFEARAGEALLLTGANGAGKTTLIRTLAGFMRPVAGDLVLQGGDREREIGEQCHYVGHLSGLKASLTAVENLDFWGRYLGGRVLPRDAMLEALAVFGLAPLADVPVGMMSAGQKRRVGLAKLAVVARPVWLLDEPTVSLDQASTEALAGVIRDHLQGGGLMIAATHLPLGLASASYLRLAGGTAEAQ